MKEEIIKIMLGWIEHKEPIETTADKLLDLFAVSGSFADAIGRNCPFCGEPCVECSHNATEC